MATPTALRTPPIDLSPRQVPDVSTYWPGVGSMFHTGTDTVSDVLGQLFALPPRRVAMDIETRGVDTGRWSITCVTASFRLGDGSLHSILLNPLREPRDRDLLRRLTDYASSLVFHNSVFDTPPLYAHGLISYEAIRKIEDTILLARMLNTIQTGGRTLEALSQRFGIATDSSVKIVDAFAAAGYRVKQDGYSHADIHMPFYRAGAMSDTAVTLRLWEAMHPVVVAVHTRGAGGASPIAMLTESEAMQLVANIQRVNQIMLQTSARGLNWDRDYMDQWYRDQEQEVEDAIRTLKAQGLDPGNGAQLVKLLDSRGELPGDWARTDKGALKSDKAAMERLTNLGHPLTRAHTIYAEHHKNRGYLEKIAESASTTGRVHPSTGILGAQASGRMSVSDPPMQQFSESARPVICSDGEDWWSVDWSSIEPVVLANAAGDTDFITPFNNGGDLYIPLARSAGLIPSSVSDEDAAGHPGRKQAKTMLLAAMYGQGLRSLSERMGISIDEAKRIQGGIKQAMRQTFAFMDNITQTCARTGSSYTIFGRMLNETLPDGTIKERVAVNHFCQGSSADVLMDAILRLDDAGMADEIRMPIHDEIVITADGLEACKEVMRTPPEALIRQAAKKNMTPVLRIDAQNMGQHWAKV